MFTLKFKLIALAIITAIMISGFFYIKYLNSAIDVLEANSLILKKSNKDNVAMINKMELKIENQIIINEKFNIKINENKIVIDSKLNTINKLNDHLYKKAYLIQKLSNNAINKDLEEIENEINDF